MLAIQRKKFNARAGFDLAFCAPMSFSLCFANADEKQRESILSAHRRAVMNGMSVYVSGRGSIEGKMDEHLESCKGDPAVHTHVFTESLTCLEVFKHREAADSRYRTTLSENMQELGYAIESAPQGSI